MTTSHEAGAFSSEVPLKVLENLAEGCQVISPDYRYLYVNSAVVVHGHKSKDELLGRTMMEVYPGIEDTDMFSVLRRCMEKRDHHRMENEFTFPDGSKGWFDLRFEPVSEGVFILSLEITERKRMEQKLIRTNRALATLSECNQTLVRAEDEQHFLRDVCRIAVDKGGYLLAWIGLKEDDETKSVRVVAHAGEAKSYMEDLEITWEDAPRGQGPAGRAIRSGDVAIARCIETDEGFEPWRAAALEHGFLSSISLPFSINGATAGALNIYAGDVDAFDTEEVTLLEELAGDLGYGIRTLRQQKMAKTNEVRIQHLNAVLRGIRDVNQLIVRERDPQALIQSTCDLLVKSRGFETCCIVVCDDDRVKLQADAGIQLKLRALRRMLADDVLPDCVKRVLRETHLVVRENPAQSCKDCPVSAEYADKRDIVALRLESDGSTLGAMLVSLASGMASDPDEISLLQEVAGDVAFALKNLKTKAERARAIEEVRASATRWSATFDAITDIVCVLSKDHELVEINKAGSETIGMPKEEIIGRKCFELVHGTKAPIAACPCASVVRTHQPTTNDYEQDGRHYELSAWPVLDQDRKLEAIVHVVRDVSEHKRLEEQMHGAQRMESVGRLAGGVAHDFNNILTVIQSFGGFVLESLDERDPAREDAKEILNAAERASKLTRQLLAFGRRQVVKPTVLNLNEAVSGLLKLLKRVIEEDIDLVTVLDSSLGNIKADVAQVEQILMNLAVNARDAMPKGGKLTIETTNVNLDQEYADNHLGVRPGPHVMLAVTDTGIGMSEEIRARIFEPFFTTKNEERGTGLGLSTVYGIVKQNNGNIWVYSEPGQGTTFKVYLPCVEEERTTVPERRHSPVVRGTETILVVEDDAGVRKATSRMLRKGGYTVLEADSGGEALLIAEKHAGEIDLMITDVVMPRMSGKELADRLKIVRPGMPVLFTSGYTDNAIVHHGVLDEGALFIEKPFSEEALLEKAREAIAVMTSGGE